MNLSILFQKQLSGGLNQISWVHMAQFVKGELTVEAAKDEKRRHREGK